MPTIYSETYEELKDFIDQQLLISKDNCAEQEARFSSIKEGTIEKLEQHYIQRGYVFSWAVKDNLFVVKVIPKDK